MYTREIKDSEQLLADAALEIEDILKKYNLCGFFAMTSKIQGCIQFSFRKWSGMTWGIGDNGYPFTQVKISMQSDVMNAVEMLDNSLLVSGYFRDELFHQSDNMQKVFDDLNKCFNVDRNNYGKKSGDLH